MFKIAEVGLATRLVSIFDHFMPCASGNKRQLRNASSRALASFSEKACPAATPHPRNFSRTIPILDLSRGPGFGHADGSVEQRRRNAGATAAVTHGVVTKRISAY